MTKGGKSRDHALQQQELGSQSAPIVDQRSSGFVAQFHAQLHFGPLPSPADLQEYNRTFPGCAERIIVMAEAQSAHRRRLETEVILGEVKREARGQIMAFVLAVLVAGGGIVLVWYGQGISGFVSLMGAVAVPMATLMLKRKQQQEELDKKKPGPSVPNHG
jgi:uncharacterized membrane protein